MRVRAWRDLSVRSIPGNFTGLYVTVGLVSRAGDSHIVFTTPRSQRSTVDSRVQICWSLVSWWDPLSLLVGGAASPFSAYLPFPEPIN